MGCGAQTSITGPREDVIDRRVAAIDWRAAEEDLDARGMACCDVLLTEQECRSIADLYEEETAFRSRVVMSRHGFGQGEYRYFSYPLPAMIQELRASLYSCLVSTANRWNQLLGIEARFPSDHASFLARCHAAGQLRPTPLLLRYSTGDFNCLHQDLYGEHVFPLQAAILLSEPHRDFEGGEFVLTEQRPRKQASVEVAPLNQGQLVIFAVRDRPVIGLRGTYRVKHRHGMSRLRAGRRHMLGIILHDAQ
jgi:hypothetical protein